MARREARGREFEAAAIVVAVARARADARTAHGAKIAPLELGGAAKNQTPNASLLANTDDAFFGLPQELRRDLSARLFFWRCNLWIAGFRKVF